MIRSQKLIAMIVVITILMSNIMLLLSNVSVARQNNVVVIFHADSDSKLKLEDDDETLTYTCSNNNSYIFNVKKDGVNVKFEKFTDEIDGRYYDTYVSEEIDSNENLYITTPEMAFDDVQIFYNEESMGMWLNDEGTFSGLWVSQELVNIDDVNNYQFTLKEPTDVNHGSDNPPATNCTVNFGTATWEIDGEVVTASIEGKTINNGPVEISNDERITLTGYNPLKMEPVVIVTEDNYTARLNVDDNNQTWLCNTNFAIPWELDLEFAVRERTGLDEEWVEREEPNTTATVNLSSDAEYANSYQSAIIEINGYPINDEIDFGEPLPSVNTAHYYYDEQANTGKVTIAFSTLFIECYKGTLEINGEEFDITEDILDYTDRTAWLNHYGHQMVTFELEVDKADTYNIKVNVDQAEGRYQWIGNFLWTTDEAEKESDLYIGNSKLEVLKVVYEIDDEEITVEGEDLLRDRFIEYDPYREFKSLVVPEGAKCTMKITPEYGYQVTSFGVNGNAIETGDAISEFTFPIHKGNFHLGAEVTAVDNKVDADSEKVQSGSIEIGNDEINSGTVVLSVSDANIENYKIAEFEEEAGDYTINNYLDIDLNQVLYKGTEEDVWREEIHELNEEATITLKLEEEIDGNNIIIIHNINDGDEYEIIETESYNPETNEITFKTKSFSNYAIASKSTTTICTVEFNSNGGTEIESQEIEFGAKVQEPEDPERDGFIFEGWFEDDTLTHMFDFETEVTTDIILYAKWSEEEHGEPENPDEPGEPENTEEYEITSGDATFTFTDEAGHDFEVTFIDVLSLTEEELEELGVSGEEFEALLELMKENTKDYGTLLKVFAIEIEDATRAHTGKTGIKIKLTEEMKKYNSFKMIYLDDENGFKAGEVVELKVSGDYAEGTLPHLSAYALVGSNVEAANETTQAENGNNPQTGDTGIGIWVVLMVISMLGIVKTVKFSRKRK